MPFSIMVEFCYVLNVLMLSVVMLNVANNPFMLSVIMLSVVAPTSQS
jgi:hypothetical protein